MDNLSVPEIAAASVENVEKKLLEEVKKGWRKALHQVKDDFNFKGNINVEYNPLIWHVAYYPIGTRIYHTLGGTFTIIEFSTPNKKIPFDIFSSSKSKIGVMAHEIAHILDDQKWYSMDYKKIAYEAENYVSREQRAELLAFFYEPLGIIDSNISLINVASYISRTNISDEYVMGYAILEALGRIGMNRNINIPLFFKEMGENQRVDIPRLLRSHITYPFSLAGLLTLPGRESIGITRTSDLIICREKLINYLEGGLNLKELNKEFEKRGYRTKTRKEKLLENMDKLLIPRILEVSSYRKAKKAEKDVKKLKFPELKDDMMDALKLTRRFLENGDRNKG